MTRLRLLCLTIGLTALLCAPATPLNAASMGVSGGHDLDALWSRAKKRFDPSSHDALVLLESRHVTVLANGDTRTKVHRVVWIGTAMGIRDHADLRIPYNSATATMTVTALRTWRNDKWWPDESAIGPTAVVETLPFALATADDYTTMRETMLLHDGVEIPCIMETAYEIEERGGGQGGIDGLWVFSQNDPSALVEFMLTVPQGVDVTFVSRNGAPDPGVVRDAGGTATYTWQMVEIDRLGSPRVTDPAAYAPYVSWSTWQSWDALGRRIVSSFNEAAVLDDTLADTLAARLEHAPSPPSKAREIASFVDECTRSIHYDTRFWSFSPRPAPRTRETAYGHGLDRAVLAAALFRQAGLGADPVYRSIGPGGIDGEVPGLSRFESAGVWVHGDGLDAFYDPVEGTLTDGPLPLHGRVVWEPATESEPQSRPDAGGAERHSRFELILSLEPGEDGRWKGHGYLGAGGRFSPHGDMAGLDGEALAFVGKVASSVLTGAIVTGYNPEVFQRDLVTVGFEFEIEALKPDAQGRIGVAIGDPAGGIMTQLPPDVHLYDERRGSPVHLGGKMTQCITLRLKTGEREIVYSPEGRETTNRIGRSALNIEKADGWVVIRRELTLDPSIVLPKDWPGLRTLLLEEDDAAGRMILMK